PAELALAGAPGQPGALQPAADVLDQPLAGDPPQLPDLLVRGAGSRFPGPGRDPEVVPDAVLEQLGELAVDPGAGVDPVGDVADRHLRLPEPQPQAPAQLQRRPAGAAAAPVGRLGQAQAHDGHVEHRVVAVGLGPELHDLLDPEAGVDPVLAEVALDEGPGEPVDAGLDRGVGGEDGPGPDRLDGRGRFQVALLDQTAD